MRCACQPSLAGTMRRKNHEPLFGPLRQMGYVVPDVEAAMRHWVEVCGVGPWFYAERLPLTAFTYGGKRYDDILLSIGLANSGDMQIELIQQRSDHPQHGPRLPRRIRRAGCSTGRAGRRTTTNSMIVRWPTATSSARRAIAPRGRFVFFRNEGHPARSSRCCTPRRPGSGSSLRCAPPRSVGTAKTRCEQAGRHEPGERDGLGPTGRGRRRSARGHPVRPAAWLPRSRNSTIPARCHARWMNRGAVVETLTTRLRVLFQPQPRSTVAQGRDLGPAAAPQELRVDCDGDTLLLLVRSGRRGLHTARPPQLLLPCGTRRRTRGVRRLLVSPETLYGRRTHG